MSNFELHREVQLLADSHSKYELAKKVVMLESKLEALEERERELLSMLEDDMR